MTEEPAARGPRGRRARKVLNRAARPGRADAPAVVDPIWGTPPELASTNLGNVLDEAVLRFRQRLRVGVDPDYDRVRERFDVLHYLLQSPHLLDGPEIDLVEHFLEHGETQRLSPEPDFSMAAYLQRHPRRRDADGRSPYLAWLDQGRAAGELADPVPKIRRAARTLSLEPQQVAELASERRSDLQTRLRTGRLGEVIARAAEVEPLIGEAWAEIVRPRLLPLSTPVVVDAFSAIHEAHAQAGFRRATVVFVVNRGRWGGGRRMEGHIAHALQSHLDADEMVVVNTDESTPTPPGRFPPGVREVDFALITRGMPAESAQHALVMLLRSFQADAIINVNSRMFYRAMRTYGRALAATERVFPVLFCNEQTSMGTWRGWAMRYFYRVFDDCAGVITDSEHLARELTTTYQLGEAELDRLHVFRAPVPSAQPVPDPPSRGPGRRPQVFWAGRWDRQKRIDLFVEIAEMLQEVDFRMWGESVLGGRAAELPTNVLAQGRYDHFSQLPLEEADLWLYTSAWDGVPSLLLEVATTGVPIVGSRVGGTGEVLVPGESWPVAEDEGAPAYVSAIREVLDDPGAARRRALQLRDRLLQERSEAAFAAQVLDVLLPGPAGTEATQ